MKKGETLGTKVWKNKIGKIFLISVLLFITPLLFTGQLYAYSIGVHKKITFEVIDQNETKINDYLKNIGLDKGVDEELKNSFSRKTVEEWIERGSWIEDIDPGILFSHYLNPLTNKGYTELGIEIGQSAYDSANDLANYGGWVWARKRLYDGLTETDKTNREKYLSIAFQSLGRAMHLVQDMAVPSHTRNDFHPPESYEKYTSINVEALTYTEVPFPYWNVSISDGAPKQIWDTDTYDGSIAYSSGNIGLAEYSNANFFSEDTIFIDFPHPAKENTTAALVEQYAKDGQLDEVWYIQGYTSQRLAAYSYFNKWLSSDKWEYNLNDSVYEDYASKLIPRAVGYSAGLLDYFFRGTLEITMPDKFVYSIINGSITPQQFTYFKAKVRNTTPDEEVQDGIIQAVAKYKIRPDYQDDLSNDPPDGEVMEGVEFSYSVSEPIVITSLSSTEPAEFSFDFTNNPIPVGITDLSLNVIFKGTLGNETDIAIAAGMKDLNEPQHFSIWNVTDRFYLDGVLRTADEIRNDPALLDRVDHDGDGVSDEPIDPYDVNTNIAFYPPLTTPTVYNATYTPLPPGRYGRIIILTDMPQPYILVYRQSTEPPDERSSAFLYPGVINQENNGIFYNTAVTTFREIIQHQWAAYSRYYPDATGISTAPWPGPVDINSYPATIYP